MLKMVLKIALVLAIAIVVINDIGRYVQTESKLHDETTKVLEWAAQNGRFLGQEKAAQQAEAMATQNGIKLTGYGQDQTTVTIATELSLDGTWVLARIVALKNRKPADTPYILTFQDSMTLE
jgi:hypothetical protein